MIFLIPKESLSLFSMHAGDYKVLRVPISTEASEILADLDQQNSIQNDAGLRASSDTDCERGRGIPRSGKHTREGLQGWRTDDLRPSSRVASIAPAKDGNANKSGSKRRRPAQTQCGLRCRCPAGMDEH